MKKSIFSILALVMVLGSGLLVLDGCKLKNPVDGFAISIKADALNAPFIFNVIDAGTGAQADLPNGYEVKVTGPGASAIYSSGGNRKIVVMQGLLIFSLRKGNIPTEENPIKFNFEFTNSKYLNLVYSVELKSLNQISEQIALVDFSNPPEGSGSVTKTVSTGTDGKTTTTEKITVVSNSAKSEEATVLIPTGTQMLDKNGNSVSGSIESKIMHADADAVGFFPGGTNVSEIKDAAGNTLPGGAFVPIGWVNINMSAGGKEVSSFSQPIDVAMEISDSMLNPETGTLYKVGDVLGVFSRSEGQNNWVKESSTTVVKNATTNKLEAIMKVNHLSAWSASNFLNPCGLPLTINFSNTTANEVLVIFDIRNKGTHFSHCYQNGPINICEFSVPANTTNYKYVTDFIPAQNLQYFYRAKNVSNRRDPMNIVSNCGVLCNSTINTIIGANNDPNIGFNLLLKCTNGSQVLLPNNYQVFYIKESDYQNTIVPANGNKPAHKIDPGDNTYAGKTWNKTTVKAIIDNNQNYNKLSFGSGTFVEGERYRFSVYYENSREDYITEPYNAAAMEIAGGYPITITLAKCPI
jgi:hypothetical protein